MTSDLPDHLQLHSQGSSKTSIAARKSTFIVCLFYITSNSKVKGDKDYIIQIRSRGKKRLTSDYKIGISRKE